MTLVDRRRFIGNTALAGLGVALVPVDDALAQSDGVRPAPMMRTPTFVQTNGISMAVYEQGSGPAVIFCHGFPELAFSWRRQVEAIAAAGYHAIAPDQRGFGLTRGPEDPTQYDLQIVCDDLAGLMDAKGIDRAVFCGHDWGGYLVWSMGRLHPQRCLGVIGLNTAAGRPEGMPPAKDARANDIVMTENYYIDTFMEPGRAEAVLEADVRKNVRLLSESRRDLG